MYVRFPIPKRFCFGWIRTVERLKHAIVLWKNCWCVNFHVHLPLVWAAFYVKRAGFIDKTRVSPFLSFLLSDFTVLFYVLFISTNVSWSSGDFIDIRIILINFSALDKHSTRSLDSRQSQALKCRKYNENSCYNCEGFIFYEPHV